MEKNVVRLCSV